MRGNFRGRTHTDNGQHEQSMPNTQVAQEVSYGCQFSQIQANGVPLSTSNLKSVYANREEERPYISSSFVQALLVSTEALTAAFSCSAWQQRLDAIRAVTTLGKQAPPRVFPLLEAALLDASSFVRAAAAQAIGEVGEKTLMEVLICRVNDPEPHVRASVIQALGTFGKATPQALLEKALEDSDEQVREAAIWAIAGLEEHVPTLKLIALLKDESELVRATAVEALGTIRHQLLQEPLIQVLTAASKDKDALVRAAAVQVLGQFGNDVPTRFFLQTFHDEDSVVRTAAVRILGEREEPICIETLILGLEDDDEIVQEEISIALGKLTLQSYRQLSSTFLLRALLHEHEQIRCIGIWIFGECKETAALPALTHLIARDSSQNVRIAAICALGKYHEQTAQEALTQVALYDPNPHMRIAAISSLGSHALCSTLTHLITHDSSQDVRIAATCTLGKYHEQAAQEALTQVALYDPNPHMRIAAILTLGEIREQGKHDSLETLLQLTEDKDLKVQAAAEQVLGQRIQRDDAANYQELETQPLEEADDTVLQHVPATNQGMLAKTLLTSLLNFIEGKKGFIDANTCNEQTLVLNFYYQNDDEHRISDALLTPLGPSVRIDSVDSALSDTNAEIRFIASKIHERLLERSWAETLILSCDLPQREQEPSGKKMPTKMVVCLVGYRQARANDVSIRQSLANYLHPHRHHPFYRLVRDWVDIAFGRMQNCSEAKIWYSVPDPKGSYRNNLNGAIPLNPKLDDHVIRARAL